jgi:hypothetical protein
VIALDDIWAFGELCALWDHPFSDREQVLRSAGLSAAEWARVREEWRERLGAGDDRAAELGRVFGEAYASRFEAGPEAAAAEEKAEEKKEQEKAARAAEEAERERAARQAERDALEEASTMDSHLPGGLSAAPSPADVAPVTEPVRARPITASGTTPVKDVLPFNSQAPSGIAAAPSPAAGRSRPSGDTAEIVVAAMPQVPELTLDQYASLCAEISVSPQRADAIFQRYGLGSQRDRPAVDRAWRERLRRDPAQYREWQDLYIRYQEYWAQKARRGPAR